MRLQQPFRGRYILLRDCSSCCCPATWGPALLWPLQLRQQAVYHVQTVVFLSNMFVVGAALAAMLGIRLDGPASRPGYCGITGGEEQRGCGPGKELGWFYGVFGRVDQCLQHSKVTMSVTMSVTPVVCCNALHPCYMSVMMVVTRYTHHYTHR
jgi:hypothetical protein